MELVWDDEALADLEDIFNWIAQESPAAAKTVVDRLFSSTELLIDFPFMGHVGREPTAGSEGRAFAADCRDPLSYRDINTPSS